MKKLYPLAALILWSAAVTSHASSNELRFFSYGLRAPAPSMANLTFEDNATGAVLDSLDFPSTQVGSSSGPYTVRLKNSGNGPLQFQAEPFVLAEPFNLASTTCTGTLAPNAACTVGLRFSPTSATTYAGKFLTVNANVDNSTLPSLTGTGTPAVVYATWDPTKAGDNGGAAAVSFRNGNLSVGIQNQNLTRATVGKTSGKWFYEIRLDANPYSGQAFADIGAIEGGVTNFRSYPGQITYGWGVYRATDGTLTSIQNVTTQGSSSPAFLSGDVLGVALDMDLKKMVISKNGTQIFVFTGLVGKVYPSVGNMGVSAKMTFTANFGATPFAFPAAKPAGFNSGLWQ